MNEIETRQRAAQFLGVPVDVEAAELKKLYRQLAKQWHPDLRGGDENQFAQLSWAYEVLTRPMPTPAHAGWNGQGAAGTQDAPTQPIPQVTPEVRRPESVPTTGVQRGVMTWVRTHVRVRLVVLAAVAAFALLLLMARTGMAWWSMGFAVPLVVLMLGRAIWSALGRPEVPWFDRDRKKGPRRPNGTDDDMPTGPIPVVTPEMLRKQPR